MPLKIKLSALRAMVHLSIEGNSYSQVLARWGAGGVPWLAECVFSVLWHNLQIWEVKKTRNGNKLLVEWGDEADNFDPITQASVLVCFP